MTNYFRRPVTLTDFGFTNPIRHKKIKDRIRGKDKMNIKEKAQAYEPTQKEKNITELEKVSTKIDITEKTKQNKEGEDYTINVFVVEDEEYRMPWTVLAQLKEQLAEKPELEFFKVKSSGSGLATKYIVIPL